MLGALGGCWESSGLPFNRNTIALLGPVASFFEIGSGFDTLDTN